MTKTPHADIQEWTRAKALLLKLEFELVALNQRRSELETERITRSEGGRVDDCALAILRGEQPDCLSLDVHLTQINGHIAATRRAIDLQRQIVAAVRGKVSKEICASLRPKYRRIIEQTACVLVQLADLVKKERDFREALIDGDVAFVGWIPPLTPFGNHPEKNLGSIGAYLIDAENLGYISR